MLILALSLPCPMVAQNKVSVDKDGYLQKSSPKKETPTTVDISKIMKHERPKPTTKKSKAPKAAKKQENYQDEEVGSPSTSTNQKEGLGNNSRKNTQENLHQSPIVNKAVDPVVVIEDDESDERFYEENYNELKNGIVSDIVNSFQDNLVQVTGGTFEMGATKEQGSEANEIEKPKHKVTVSDFKISKYEITQKQWMVIMGNNPSEDQEDSNKPVTNVSYRDVMEFIKKLNDMTGLTFRLPTEQEWEYAARGGHRLHGKNYYKYAGADSSNETAWTKDNSNQEIHPVGRLYPNELGLYDMSGNVMEWCADRFQSYDPKRAKKNNNTFYSGDNYVCRGGSSFDEPVSCRVSSRTGVGENEARPYIGFRLAM